MSQDAVDALVKLLDLEPIEVNIFRGVQPDEERQRVFGGQVAGQALVAAARTVEPERRVHSLHAYFLRPGRPDACRSSTRSTASATAARSPPAASSPSSTARPSSTCRRQFQRARGRASSTRRRCRDVPAARDAPRLHAPHGAVRRAAGRLVQPAPARSTPATSTASPPDDAREPLPPDQQVWLRADGDAARRPGAARLRRHLRVSDMTLLDTALLPHGRWARRAA